MVKLIIGNFDKVKVYFGKSFDTEAGLCFSFTEDANVNGESENTSFLFFNDGLKNPYKFDLNKIKESTLGGHVSEGNY